MPNGISSRAQPRGVRTSNKSTHPVLIWALVLTSLAPYAAIGIGQNTNVPLASVVSGVIIASAITVEPDSFRPYLALALLPVLGTFLALIFSSAPANWVTLVTWVLFTLPFGAFALIGRISPAQLLRPLRFALWASCAFAIVQKFVFLDRGSIPLIGYYRAPGYASVEANAQVIVTYVKRPFGLFPEPSFMAGTLILAFSGLVVANYASQSRIRRSDMMLGAVLVAVLYLSRSGAAIAGCALLAVMLGTTLRPGWRKVVVFAGSGVVSAGIAAQTLGARSSVLNWSWDDRLTSIQAASRYALEDLSTLLFGVGRGNTVEAFASGDVRLDGYQYFHIIPDIYSVVGRLLFENGLLVGGAMVAILVASQLKAAQTVGKLRSVIICVLWVLVAGLTISYDSATWIWALPGLCVGAACSRIDADDQAHP